VPPLRKCLATTNVIETSLSGAEGRTGGVTRWRSGEMALRWAAAAALDASKTTAENANSFVDKQHLAA